MPLYCVWIVLWYTQEPTNAEYVRIYNFKALHESMNSTIYGMRNSLLLLCDTVDLIKMGDVAVWQVLFVLVTIDLTSQLFSLSKS